MFEQIAKVLFTKKVFFLSLGCLGILTTLKLWDVYFFYNGSNNYFYRGFLHLAVSIPLLPLFRLADYLKFGSSLILVYLLFSPF